MNIPDNRKSIHESFCSFFEELQPLDYHSKMVIEILFKVLMDRSLPKTRQNSNEQFWDSKSA
jgi:hypothetical protein